MVDSALVFHDAAPAVRFYATSLIDRLADPPPDGSHRARLVRLVNAAIQERIAAEGAFRVPKTQGFFVATVQALP